MRVVFNKRLAIDRQTNKISSKTENQAKEKLMTKEKNKVFYKIQQALHSG